MRENNRKDIFSYIHLSSIYFNGAHGPVFLRDGKLIQDVRGAFNASLKLAGIEDFRFHDLRHTFASHFVMNGFPIQALQQVLGNSSLAMTMRYADLADHCIKDTLEGYSSKMRGGTDFA